MMSWSQPNGCPVVIEENEVAAAIDLAAQVVVSVRTGAVGPVEGSSDPIDPNGPNPSGFDRSESIEMHFSPRLPRSTAPSSSRLCATACPVCGQRSTSRTRRRRRRASPSSTQLRFLPSPSAIWLQPDWPNGVTGPMPHWPRSMILTFVICGPLFVVANDVARDEESRGIADQLKTALDERMERDHGQWLADLRAAVSDGRVVRALRLSSRPVKAGAPLPTELAGELSRQAAAALAPDVEPSRWAIVLDALAFSPVRGAVTPVGVPAEPGEELLDEVRRLSDRIPTIAGLFGIDPAQVPRRAKRRRPSRSGGKGQNRRPKSPTGDRRKPEGVAAEKPEAEATRAVEPTAEAPAEPSAEPVEPTAEAPAERTAEPVEPTAEAPAERTAEPVEPTAEAPAEPSAEPVQPTAEAPVEPSAEPVEPTDAAPEQPTEAEADAVAVQSEADATVDQPTESEDAAVQGESDVAIEQPTESDASGARDEADAQPADPVGANPVTTEAAVDIESEQTDQSEEDTQSTSSTDG